MRGFTRLVVVALGAVVLFTGSVQAQTRGPAQRQQLHRGERLQRQGNRMQREAWRMDRHAERLAMRGFEHKAKRLDRAAEHRMRQGMKREWRGRRMERHGWI